MKVSDCPTEKLLIEPLIIMDMVVVVERNLLTLWIFIETLILFIGYRPWIGILIPSFAYNGEFRLKG